MTGAMYAAISGLKSHMSKLNVIGNNVANVNTFGYKAQRAVFSDSLYVTSTGGSNGTTTTGARNPSQVGYGVQISSIDLDMSTGTFSPTANGLDCMIQGDGFFLVGDKTTCNTIDASRPDSLKALNLTRVGNFEFKADGYLTNNDSSVVYGFMCIGNVNGEPIFSDQLVPIRYPKMQTVVDNTTTPPTETLMVRYATQAANGRLTDATGENGAELPFVAVDSVSISPETGRITATTKDTGEVITIGIIAMGNVTNPNGVTHLDGPYYKAGDGAGDLQVALMGGIGDDMYIGNSDQLPADAPPTDLTGFTRGITSVNGSLLNGANPPQGMRVYDGGTTSLKCGGLEASKADLATEISEMITTQRGYQANTRIITVTDSMLEELVNMKR